MRKTNLWGVLFVGFLLASTSALAGCAHKETKKETKKKSSDAKHTSVIDRITLRYTQK